MLLRYTSMSLSPPVHSNSTHIIFSYSPSSDTVRGYWERFRVERGQAVGPRIFHTGTVIYGGGAPGLHEDITTLDEAYSALIRIKAEGGPASFSYKNYQLPSR